MSVSRVHTWYPAGRPLRTQLYFFHLGLLLVSLPFDPMYSHLVMISFCLQLLLPAKISWKEKKIPWEKILLPASVFFCTGFSLLYSPARAEGAREWLLQLPMLLMPLLFFVIQAELRAYRDQLLTAFSVVSLICVIYLFSNALWTIRHFSLPLSALFSSAFTNHNFSEPLKIHATYLSMQWLLALVFVIQKGGRTAHRPTRNLYYGAGILIMAGLLQLCSKSVGAALLAVATCAWPLVIKNRRRRLKAVFYSVAVLALLFIAVSQSPAFKERYLSALREDFIRPAAGELAEPRVARWISTWELARNTLLLGKGAGTEKALLHEVFYRKKFYNSFLNHLNAHSEYLSLLLKNGVVGLGLYLATLTAGFRVALRRRDPLYLSFMLLITLVSFGENILDLDKGVWFFAVFNSFFLFFPELPATAQPGLPFTRTYRKARIPIIKKKVIAIAGNN